MRSTWIVASVLSILALAGFGSLSYWGQYRALDQSRRELAEARNLAQQRSSELGRYQTQIDRLEAEKQEAARAQKSLEQEMRRALESQSVAISDLQGKLTVEILDHILFDSGQAELKPEGEQVLRRLAAVLAQHPHRQVHVIGHTDNVPIYISYPSNWELSTARATAAVRFLCEKAGMDARRLGAVGYGEHRPIADNSTPEGRARNRRIAIVILSEELAGADTSPTARPVPLPETPAAGALRPPVPVLTNVPPMSTNLPAGPTNASALPSSNGPPPSPSKPASAEPAAQARLPLPTATNPPVPHPAHPEMLPATNGTAGLARPALAPPAAPAAAPTNAAPSPASASDRPSSEARPRGPTNSL